MISGNKIHFTSLGCARNLVDSEVMLGILLKAGYEATEDLKEADFLVVNTCGFLKESREESCQVIEELLREKKKGSKLIVTGCMVQKHGDEIRERFRDVHYFLGSGDMEKILEAVETPEAGEAITSAKSFLQWGEVPRKLSTPKHYAYLKIAEGCLKRCSFCIIPQIKGPLKSKPVAQVLKEFHLLLDQGVFEVILIAQDLGDWGKENRGKERLGDLVKEMLKVKKDFWLRFLYLYPDEIDDELIQLIKDDPRICPYLDMPIQHVNDRMLKLMRRKTSKQDLIHTIQKLRSAIPDIVIRTSLMVGFPGETEEEFEELLDFVREHPLDHVGIFKYSREETSHSAGLPGHLDQEVKEKRFKKLAKAQEKVVAKVNRKYLNRKLKVMIDGYHPDSPLLMRGRFCGQCPEIDGQVIINDCQKVKAFGMLHEVLITDIAGYDLIGTAVRPCSSSRLKLI